MVNIIANIKRLYVEFRASHKSMNRKATLSR